MTDKEMDQLIILWMKARGGTATDADFDALAAILGEYLPSPDEATLEDALRVLGLSSMPES
ncbi:MAG: hypothetical protein HY669_00690 [Chloroflexi bacterium]|nr:hypothetical protein [Chloroflexota bacterium]